MEVYTWTPDYSYTEDITFATEITTFESGVEQRRARRSQAIRTFNLTYKLLDDSEMDEIWDFFIARYGALNPFLYRNYPNNYLITDESIGTGDGDSTNTTFYFDWYPVTTESLTPGPAAPLIYVSGVLQDDSTYSIDRDNRMLTFNSAPTGAITATYEFFYKVRFVEDNISTELFAQALYKTGIKLKQLLI